MTNSLNFMFTVAAVSTNVCALPVGTILDRYGPRVCGIIGSIFLFLGCFFFAFAWQLSFDGYIPGYFFLALGGPFIFISSFQLSNTFPQYSGLILALLTGAFDTSSAIFLFYRLIYQATNGTFWPKKFFLAYLVVPAFVLVVQIFLMPQKSYKTVGELVAHAEEEEEQDNRAASIENGHSDPDDERARLLRRERRESVLSEITELLGSKDAARQTQKEEQKRNISGVWGALHGLSASQQIMTPWFILITLFTVVQMLRINYFVATVRNQYESLLGSHDKAVAINDFFDVALPLGGVLSVPFIGLILDNTSTAFCLGLLVTVATTIGVLGIIPQMWAAYANVCLFVVYRPLYYTTVS
jgi:MFS family permease